MPQPPNPLGTWHFARPGLGGHCIPIDPFYLTWKAREFGKHTALLNLRGDQYDHARLCGFKGTML